MRALMAGYGSSAAYEALPAGRHTLGPEYVERHQRQRMVVAVAELAHEKGLAGVTVSGLTARARISRKTFYEYFANLDECLDYAGEEAAAYLLESPGAMGPGQSADERIAAGVDALLGAVAAEPNLAELALVHAPALGGKRGRRFQEIAVERIAALVGAAEAGTGAGAGGTETIASAIIGVIACQVRRGEADRVGELAEEVVRLARLPAVGVEGVATKHRS
jgi:AcrR family transcriptional regulator